MKVTFTEPVPERKPTEYKRWFLENKMMEILYYRGWEKHRKFGITFWCWDNIFIPVKGSSGEYIQRYNTDLDAFEKQYPYIEDYIK